MGVPGVAENFTDELDLVGALMLRWHARLTGNIERALADEPIDLAYAVAAAWRTTAEELPGVRMVIDRSMSAPSNPEMERAMNRAHDREAAYLATAAGLSSGRALLRSRQVAAWSSGPDRARRTAGPERVPEAPSESFADRIRAVLAA